MGRSLVCRENYEKFRGVGFHNTRDRQVHRSLILAHTAVAWPGKRIVTCGSTSFESLGENVVKRTLSFAIVMALLVAANAALGEPSELGLSELERITAAGYEPGSDPAPNGGAIVGNGSQATLDSVGEVTLDDSAQSDAKALNLVNSSESAVANGVNVFDSSALDTTAQAGNTFNIEQLNVIQQDQRRLSSLPNYSRPEANTEVTYVNSGSSEGSSSLSIFDEVVDLEQTIVLDEAVTDGSFSKSSAATLTVDANAELVIDNDAGIPGPEFDLNGELFVEFNMPSAANSVGVVFNGEIDFGIDGGEVFVDTEVGVSVEIMLPELALEFDAMGCVAVNGGCTIQGSRTESTTETSDHSTLYTLDESASHASTHARSGTESVRAPFELNNAQAEYIVVDQSSIDVSAAYLVSLAGSAQSNLRAMNVVNAAGSAVANGINVSRHSTGSGESYNISQINEITNSR